MAPLKKNATKKLGGIELNFGGLQPKRDDAKTISNQISEFVRLYFHQIVYLHKELCAGTDLEFVTSTFYGLFLKECSNESPISKYLNRIKPSLARWIYKRQIEKIGLLIWNEENNEKILDFQIRFQTPSVWAKSKIDNFQEMFKFLQENLKNVLFKLQNAKISRPDISTKGNICLKVYCKLIKGTTLQNIPNKMEHFWQKSSTSFIQKDSKTFPILQPLNPNVNCELAKLQFFNLNFLLANRESPFPDHLNLFRYILNKEVPSTSNRYENEEESDDNVLILN